MTSQTLCAPNTALTHDPGRWIALSVLLTGALLPVLDFNIINLALPAIRQDLHATSGQIQFVISAYAAVYAVFLITGGRLGDRLGRKRMFTAGIAGFTLASVLCGLAWSAQALIAGRVLQGLTATIMAPQVLASIRVLFPREERGWRWAFMAQPSAWPEPWGRFWAGCWWPCSRSACRGRRFS